jgi:hypothetical protein
VIFKVALWKAVIDGWVVFSSPAQIRRFSDHEDIIITLFANMNNQTNQKQKYLMTNHRADPCPEAPLVWV